jgi:peptide subunit release factor 1 (eRF1)
MQIPAPNPATWFNAEGPFVSCWLPALSATEDPANRLRLEWRHAQDQIPGAPEAAVRAIDELLGSERAHQANTSLLLFADASGAVAGVQSPDQTDSSRAWLDSLPRLGPVLNAKQQTVPHLVVVADRAGADIEVVDNGESDSETVDGDTLHIQRSHPGGWSQRRFQQRAENTWERNAKGVADEVDALREKIHARLVVVTGDPRAVGFLMEHASERLKEVLHHIDGAGRSDQQPFEEVADEVGRLEATVVANDRVAVLEHFAAAGQTEGVADGPERTLAMLSQGRVSDLLVHDDPDDDRRAMFDRASRQVALEGEPLRELGLEPEEGRLIDVALWAAHATGAAVHFVPRSGPKAPTGSLGGILRG